MQVCAHESCVKLMCLGLDSYCFTSELHFESPNAPCMKLCCHLYCVCEQ